MGNKVSVLKPYRSVASALTLLVGEWGSYDFLCDKYVFTGTPELVGLKRS